jgi:hypothetical protein
MHAWVSQAHAAANIGAGYFVNTIDEDDACRVCCKQRAKKVQHQYIRVPRSVHVYASSTVSWPAWLLAIVFLTDATV